MSGLLTHLVDAQIRDSAQTLYGATLSRPALAKTDGSSLTYAVDVKISADDQNGVAFYDPDDPNDPNRNKPHGNVPDPVIDRAYSERILRAVPIAVGNRDLIYAEAGSPVMLARASNGKFEVVGFSKKMPGIRKIIAVNLDTMIPGTPMEVGIRVHILTLGDLMDERFGDGFGSVPFGAYAIMQGSTVLEVMV